MGNTAIAKVCFLGSTSSRIKTRVITAGSFPFLTGLVSPQKSLAGELLNKQAWVLNSPLSVCLCKQFVFSILGQSVSK